MGIGMSSVATTRQYQHYLPRGVPGFIILLTLPYGDRLSSVATAHAIYCRRDYVPWVAWLRTPTAGVQPALQAYMGQRGIV